MIETLGRHWLPITVLVAGMALTGAFSWWTQATALDRAELLMERRARLVAQSVAGAVGDTLQDAAGAAGLFEASEEVTEEEWHRFAEKIGHQPGSLGLAYLPVVPAGDLPAHLAEARTAHPSYRLFRVDPSGERVPPGPGEVFHPIRYFAPPPGSDLELLGLVAEADPAWAEALGRAQTEGRPVVSPLGTLPFGSSQGYLAAASIDEGDQRGFTAVLVRLDLLVEAELAGSLLPLVTWSVTDTVDAASLPESTDPLVRVEQIEVSGRTWLLEVRPTETARADLVPGRAPGVTMGLLLSLLAGLVAHLGTHLARRAREADELRRLTREKDEFLAAVSHELRTPLTVVVGMAEILAEALEDPAPAVAEYLGMLRESSEDLAALVEDLLLMGRLEANAFRMHPQAVDVRWEAERILSEYDRPPGTTVHLVGNGLAWADPLRLRQILRNLVGNALHHGGERVTIRIEEGPSEVRVTVSDDGTGVPADQAPHLFSASLSTKATPGGPSSLGLGLRISARLALAMGGGLDYRRQEGETTFELRLPWPRTQTTPEGPAEETPTEGRDRSNAST